MNDTPNHTPLPSDNQAASRHSSKARCFVGLLGVAMAAASLVAVRHLLVGQPAHGPVSAWPPLQGWAMIWWTLLAWVLAVTRDPLMGLIVPLLYPLAGASWWRVVLAWACNSFGEVGVLAAATLLVPPGVWGCLGCVRGEATSRQSWFHAGWCAPCPLRALYALYTELSFVPGIGVLFLFEKLLVDICSSHWHWPLDGNAQDEPYIILLHGAGINQCQWAAARHLLHLGGLRRVLSVNYLLGAFRKDSDDLGLPELAERTVEEISRLGLEEAEVVLVGHSCGGLVAAYMLENDLLPAELSVRAVVAVSSPYSGSALLAWAQRRVPWTQLRPCPLDDWLVPSSPGLQTLRAQMRRHSGRYRLLTGSLDPMVRPDSALWDGAVEVPQEHRVLLPHLGHYNIAGSPMAWKQVLHWVAEAEAVAWGAGYDAPTAPR